MIEPLSGAVAIGFVVAAALSLHRARQSGDGLFFALSAALVLLAINQFAVMWLGEADKEIAYVFLLRVLGFLLVLAVLMEKRLRRR